jgi:hypothetical protein
VISAPCLDPPSNAASHYPTDCGSDSTRATKTLLHEGFPQLREQQSELRQLAEEVGEAAHEDRDAAGNGLHTDVHLA